MTLRLLALPRAAAGLVLKLSNVEGWYGDDRTTQGLQQHRHAVLEFRRTRVRSSSTSTLGLSSCTGRDDRPAAYGWISQGRRYCLWHRNSRGPDPARITSRRGLRGGHVRRHARPGSSAVVPGAVAERPGRATAVRRRHPRRRRDDL